MYTEKKRLENVIREYSIYNFLPIFVVINVNLSNTAYNRFKNKECKFPAKHAITELYETKSVSNIP